MKENIKIALSVIFYLILGFIGFYFWTWLVLIRLGLERGGESNLMGNTVIYIIPFVFLGYFIGKDSEKKRQDSEKKRREKYWRSYWGSYFKSYWRKRIYEPEMKRREKK